MPGRSLTGPLLLLLLPAALSAQSIHGRVLDPGRQPLVGALIELRDEADKPLQIVLTTSSGTFELPVAAPGRYRYRVAAIGFQPRPYAAVDVPAAGVALPDVILQRMVLRLPDLVAIGRLRFCGKSSPSDEIFDRVLESAQSALQIMEAGITTRQVGFEVARIDRRTFYGGFANFEAADTTIEALTSWPIQSIDPDTLRQVGFGRESAGAGGVRREYYGPDVRVLLADWFLQSHCFTVDKPKKGRPADSMHVRFAPAHKSKLIDVGGELVLDAHDLSLLQFSFTLKNLPSWMPEDGAGGYMEFARLPSGFWFAKSWAMWAPDAAADPYDRRLRVSGQMERFGWVMKVFTGRDSILVVPP